MPTIAGMKPASFSQKLWRFSAYRRLEVAALIEPMHNLIRQEMAERPGVLLAIHDWSTLSFGGHASKTDRVELTHANDVGYDLANVLMVRGDAAAPISSAFVLVDHGRGRARHLALRLRRQRTFAISIRSARPWATSTA